METPEFPRKMFTKGDEPLPTKSIGYFSGDAKLLTALASALVEDEWAELCDSKLGVFLKFYRLDFGWASRLVHYMLSFQLVCDKKYEIWSLIGVTPARFSLLEFECLTKLNCEYVENLENPEVEVTQDMKDFWQLLGVGFEMGPSTNDLTAACKVCGSWTREDRIRLGYLSIYAVFIEARKSTTPTQINLARLVMDLDEFENYPWGRVAFKNLIESVKERVLTKTYCIEGFVQTLQVWVYNTLPDFAAIYTDPIPNNPTPPLLAYKGSRGRKYVKEAMLKQVRINNCVVEEYEDMFPLWDDDEDDAKIDNILKAMYGHFGDDPSRWSKKHWSVVGVKTSNNVKSEANVENKRSISSDDESRKRSRSVSDSVADEGFELSRLKSYLDSSLKVISEQMMAGFSGCQQNIKDLVAKVDTLEQSLETAKFGMKKKEQEKDEDEHVTSNEDNAEYKSNNEKKTDNVRVSTKPSSKNKRDFVPRKSARINMKK